MKDFESRNVTILARFKALFYDWIVISIYLLLLFLIIITFYFLIWDGIPDFNHLHSQWIAFLTSIIPVVLFFSYREGSNKFATLGKKRVQLRVNYEGNPLRGSIIRNTMKFLPWQLGHMSTIYGIYYDFESAIPLILLILSMTLAITYILMAVLRQDGRHLGDFLAGSRVTRVG